jgi:acetyltransferase-like isoleucine patch superfamily enzyme
MKHGKSIYIEPPFRCDYGKHIEIGDNFYANSGCIIIDVATVKIGDNVMLGPNVAIITAGHPIHYAVRNTKYEYGIPITIGNNVWIGANVVILPGANIGDNTVIGAGSVVTKDIPSNVVAVGNPCKPIKIIKDEDKQYYYKDRCFDNETWEHIQKILNEETKL